MYNELSVYVNSNVCNLIFRYFYYLHAKLEVMQHKMLTLELYLYMQYSAFIVNIPLISFKTLSEECKVLVIYVMASMCVGVV